MKGLDKNGHPENYYSAKSIIQYVSFDTSTQEGTLTDMTLASVLRLSKDWKTTLPWLLAGAYS
jgi:hypothetical protein